MVMLTQSYTSLVHSQLLYCSQIWRPVLIKDTQKFGTNPVLSNEIHSKWLLHQWQKSAFKITLAPSHDDSETPRYIVLCKNLKAIGSELAVLL